MSLPISVTVKSPAVSKINIAQIVSIVATVLALFGLDVSPELQAQIVAVIGAINGLVTIVSRTYFTTSVTPQSARRIAGG